MSLYEQVPVIGHDFQHRQVPAMPPCPPETAIPSRAT